MPLTTQSSEKYPAGLVSPKSPSTTTSSSPVTTASSTLDKRRIDLSRSDIITSTLQARTPKIHPIDNTGLKLEDIEYWQNFHAEMQATDNPPDVFYYAVSGYATEYAGQNARRIRKRETPIQPMPANTNPSPGTEPFPEFDPDTMSYLGPYQEQIEQMTPKLMNAEKDLAVAMKEIDKARKKAKKW
jgi:hypothetical protein